MPAETTINRDDNADAGAILRTKVRRTPAQGGGLFWTAGRWGVQKRGASAFLFETADLPLLTPGLDIMVTAVPNNTATDISGRVPFLLFDLTTSGG